MEMRKCQNGHYYDAALHRICPYCDNKGNFAACSSEDLDRTVPLMRQASQQEYTVLHPKEQTEQDYTVPLPRERTDCEYTVPLQTEKEEQEYTVPIIQKKNGIDPVVGWLVIIEGADRGKDFRLHSENNFIGRDSSMSVCLAGDESVSRENHAIIAFDENTGKFYCAPGNTRSLVKINAVPQLQTIELKEYDEITVGNTKLLLITLCGEHFNWENQNAGNDRL